MTWKRFDSDEDLKRPWQTFSPACFFSRYKTEFFLTSRVCVIMASHLQSDSRTLGSDRWQLDPRVCSSPWDCAPHVPWCSINGCYWFRHAWMVFFSFKVYTLWNLKNEKRIDRWPTRISTGVRCFPSFRGHCSGSSASSTTYPLTPLPLHHIHKSSLMVPSSHLDLLVTEIPTSFLLYL